jgi:nucleoside triphosphate diphosphatase
MQAGPRMGDPQRIARALGELDELTRRLRRECPWDREQDERSIVPHTLEEAYELADAAQRGDDAKLVDELGDVLFQVHFLSLLLEERGAGDLGEVAEHCRQKLIRRHPHVFGEAEVAGAAEVLRNWDAIKQTEPGREGGIFGEVPDNLPALLYARKLQRRAASAGLHPPADEARPDRESFREIGERLFALVDEARRRQVDPELALRAAAEHFRELHTDPQET